MKKTVIVLPLNDWEAVMIWKIARALGLDCLTSNQSRGASIDKEKGLFEKLKKGDWERIVIIEMPGVKMEKKLAKLGKELVLIDHHNYEGLSRAFDEKGKPRKSSIEQFLTLFRLGEVRLKALGFKPRQVKAIGIMDRDFVWGLRKAKYSWAEIKKMFVFADALMEEVRPMKGEKQKVKVAEQAWEKRERWNDYYVVTTNTPHAIRQRLSRIMALELKKRTPLIVVEKGRDYIYVQESPRAMDLFKEYGGFTFGEHQNWGYKNEKGKKRMTLKEVKYFLAS